MAIIAMEKLRLYVHKGVSTEVFNVIQKMGIVEFNEVKTDKELEKAEKTIFEFNYASSRLDFAIEFLSKYEKPKSKFAGFKYAMEGGKIFAKENEIEETMQSFYFNDVIEHVENIEEKMNDTNSKLKNLEEERELLSGWTKLDIELSSQFETKTTKTIFLTGEQSEQEIIAKKLSEMQILFNKKIIENNNFILTFAKYNEKEVLKKIAEYNLEIIELPKRRGTPAEEVERIGRAIIKTEEIKSKLEKEAGDLATELRKLKLVSDRIFWKKEKHDLISQAAKKGDVLIFEGWCPKEKIEKLEDILKKETGLFAIEKIEPEEGESAPVEIQNNKLIVPFEAVTRLYGLPGNKDIDPTPLLAGFFFIFFGLSLTDVGYGLFLFSVTALALLFFRIPKGAKPLILLLMFGGISSVLVGLLFGGYFGINMEYMPSWTQAIQKFDPIANPLPVFYMALGFGVFQIMFGLILKIVRDAKNGEFISGILDQGPWLALFSSLIFWGTTKIGLIEDSASISVLIIYASLLSLVLTQGRKESTFVGKIFKGVFSLYNSINYFSDILSYSRLLALGLATSALAFAVNLIAVMVGDMIPYVGPVLMVIILIIGHLFNLAVNVLGAFIHSARLQFVEFFGKFITDNGRIFTPFKREERHVVVVK